MNCKNCGEYVEQKRLDRATPFCNRKCYFEWNRGSNHSRWIGDDIGYYGVHSWIERIAGKPRKCEKCNNLEAKKYEWANISYEYKRDRSDWIRLCSSCHQKMDKHREKQWKTIKESCV